MGGEQVLFMEQDLSGYKPVNSLYDVPEDEKDAYVVKVALERGANPPSEKSGRPVILTEHLDLHIRKRIQELETAAETATGDQAEKLRAKRDALATLLPGL